MTGSLKKTVCLCLVLVAVYLCGPGVAFGAEADGDTIPITIDMAFPAVRQEIGSLDLRLKYKERALRFVGATFVGNNAQAVVMPNNDPATGRLRIGVIHPQGFVIQDQDPILHIRFQVQHASASGAEPTVELVKCLLTDINGLVIHVFHKASMHKESGTSFVLNVSK